MPITRKRKNNDSVSNRTQGASKIVSNSTSSKNTAEPRNVVVPLSTIVSAPSKIVAPNPYFFVSKLCDNKTMAADSSFLSNQKVYVLMEGDKRLMGWGHSQGYSLTGASNEGADFQIYPAHTQYDYPLDRDDYITQFTFSCGHRAGFVTAKGYVYLAGYQDDDGWMGIGHNQNRYAFTKIGHADSTAVTTYSSGGAVNSTTFVVASGTGIAVGQYAVGDGIPPGTTVTAVSGTTITLSAAFNVLAQGQYSFGLPWGPTGIKAKKLYLNGGTYNSGPQLWAVVLGEDGNVYTCGYNVHGQMANGTTTVRRFWSRVTSLSNIKEVYLGGYSCYALNYAGQLYAWGWNGQGQLGNGNTTSQSTPVLTASNVDSMYIKSHDYDTAFYISKDGKVFAAGSNYYGALGIGVENTGNTTSWTAVTTNIGSKRVVQINANGTGTYNSTWFLCDDGTVFACGYNGYGQLGDNTTTTRTTPTQLIIPAGFPKTTRLISGGGSTTHFVTGISMETGRMWSVGSYNYGAIGQAIGDVTGTWAMTSTTNRAQYPAREVTSIPSVEDGYTTLKDFYVTSAANDTTTVWALCEDGTLWVRGYGYRSPKGHKMNFMYYDSGHVVTGQQGYDASWKQVEF